MMPDNTASQSLGTGSIYDKYFEEAEKNKSGNEGVRASSQSNYPVDETRSNCNINITPDILSDDSRQDAESASKMYADISDMTTAAREDPRDADVDDLISISSQSETENTQEREIIPTPHVTDTHVDENGAVTECAQLACISTSSTMDNNESFSINPHNVRDETDYHDGSNFDYCTNKRPMTPDVETCTDLVVCNETAIQEVPSNAIVETSTGVPVTAPNGNTTRTTPPPTKTNRDIFVPEEPPAKKPSSGGKKCCKVIAAILLFLVVLGLGVVLDQYVLEPYVFSSSNNSDDGAADPNNDDDGAESADETDDADRSAPLITTITPSLQPTISRTTSPTVALTSSPSVIPSSSPTYIQMVNVGRPIYGTTSDALFGFSLSLSFMGQRVGIGAPYKNEPDDDLYRAGHAIAYARSQGGSSNIFDGSNPFDVTLYDTVDEFNTGNVMDMSVSQAREFWGEEEWSAMGDGVYGKKDNDWVGWVVPVSPEGDWYAVCGGFMSRPFVNVYEQGLTGNNWVLRGNTIQGPGSGFGLSISLSKDGKRLAVGSRGYARVYQFIDGANRWVPVGGDIEESMVATVSISGDGDFVAVGCYGDDTKYPNGGRVRVFELNLADNELNQVGESYYGNGPEDGFGYAVSLSFFGRIVAAGTYSSNYVKVGKYDETSQTWIPMGDDIVGGELDLRFGSSLALSDSARRLVVGSSKYDGDRGRTVVYRNMEDGTWNEIGDVVGNLNDREGYSVAISPDGEFVASGAPYGDNESTGTVDCGRVRIMKIMSFD